MTTKLTKEQIQVLQSIYQFVYEFSNDEASPLYSDIKLARDEADTARWGLEYNFATDIFKED